MSTLEVAVAAPKLSEVVAGVAGRGERVTLTEHGAPLAVMVRPRDLWALSETIDLLSDRDAMRRILDAEHAIQEGAVLAGSDLGALDPQHRFAAPGSHRPAGPATAPEGYWELMVSHAVQQALARMPGHLADKVLHLLFDQLVADPQRFGVELSGGLSRRFVARVETEKVIYRLDSVKRSVRVIEVLHGPGLPGHPGGPGHHW